MPAPLRCDHSNHLLKIFPFFLAATARASGNSAEIIQPDADDDAVSRVGTTVESIVAGAGLPAKADVAAVANAVA